MRSCWLMPLLLVLGPLTAAAQAGQAADSPSTGAWNFRVRLDGKPIGEHRFTLTQQDGQRLLRSQARFDVKLLGITVYRYRHEATETWRGDCLTALEAKTDDDGKLSSVDARQDGAALAVRSDEAARRLEGCVLSFAYWNPAMLRQTRLLNAQTGKDETVRIEPLGTASVEVRGQAVPAQRWRISGVEQPIELWYSPQGDWLALESKVSGGGRTLSYRRE